MTHTEYKNNLGKTISAMTKEERKEYYRLRYHSHTKQQRTAHNSRNKAWYHSNQSYSRASAHTSTIKKKYPEALIGSDVSTPEELRVWTDTVANKECTYCGQSVAHIDHKQPLAKGGKHHTSNLQMLCARCNYMKLDLTEQEFLSHVYRIGQLIELSSE